MKYYYSKTLSAYIDLEPLRINQRVMRIAAQLDIKLSWDDDGYVCNITFEEAKRITAALGGFMMSPVEFWRVYDEAYTDSQNEVIDSLTSHSFTEFLDRVYYSSDEYIEHPQTACDNCFAGEKSKRVIPAGRPGWFLFEDIDLETGVPSKTRVKGVGDKALMKYWDPDVSVSSIGTCVAIRGYVTSVDNISLDLGIPVDSRQPKLMIRLCTYEEPESFLLPQEYEYLDKVISGHNEEQIEQLFKSDLFRKLCLSEDNNEVSLREQIISTLGYARIKSNKRITNLLTYDSLASYILSCRDKMNKAANDKKKLVFVIGHRNPDSDTVVSSIVEAYRLDTYYGSDNSVYIPLIQAEGMPAEIRALIGDVLSDAIIYENQIPLHEWIESGIVRFVYTDQNYQKEYQKYVLAVTDHHSPAQELKEHEPTYSFLVESVGSATSLVVRKLYGHNCVPDEAVARILYGAMLMDTENRVPHKMTSWDELIMNAIKELAKIDDDSAFYSSLMKYLLEEKDWRKLYYRDYKYFRGYDFAELKVVDFIGNKIYEPALADMILEATENNLSKNTYLTLVKLTQYYPGGKEIELERIYTIFNTNTVDEVRCKSRELLRAIIKVNFPEAIIREDELYIEITGVGKQISRKKIAPPMEKLLLYMNQYMYIERIDKWVSREFLHMSDSVKAVDSTLMVDAQNRICGLSFPMAKKLMDALGLGMLDIREYWAVYDEVLAKKDSNMLDSLTDSTFIEYLDTGANNGEVIHHPILQKEDDGVWKVIGLHKESSVMQAKPGLINPAEIDRGSGLPEVVHHPDDYENKLLWRYWSPPKEGCYVFSRSYIFLLGQVCLDAKMTLNEGFVNLGIRPVRSQNLKVDIRISTDNGKLNIFYKSEDDLKETLIYE